MLDEVALRDRGLLASAAARPQTTVFGEDAYPSFAEKAAALMHSLARNHPLVDGNRRLAWAATRVFCLLVRAGPVRSAACACAVGAVRGAASAGWGPSRRGCPWASPSGEAVEIRARALPTWSMIVGAEPLARPSARIDSVGRCAVTDGGDANGVLAVGQLVEDSVGPDAQRAQSSEAAA